MKNILKLITLAVLGVATGFGADAANDLILTQRKSDNSGNIQRNVAPSVGGIISFDVSKIPTGSPLGTGVLTALGTNVGSAGAPVLFNGAGGTPSSITLTNATGTAASLTAGTVTTNANLTGDVTSVGNSTTLATVATAGTTGSSTAIPVITINAKGLTTGITTAAVVAPAGTLTGTTLASNVVTSSITTVGALTSGSIGNGFGAINVGTNSITGGAGSFTTLGTSDNVTVTTSNAAVKGFYATNSTHGMVSGLNNAGLIRFGSTTATDVSLVYNGNVIGLISATGLAVTGIATVSSQITAGSTGASGSAWFRAGGSLASYSGIDFSDSSDTSGAFFAAFRKGAGTVIGSITRVTTTDAVAYNTTSDGRLKTNIRDFTAADSGRLIDALRPRWFDWKQDPNDTFQTGMTPDVVDASGKVTAKGKPIHTKRKDLDAVKRAQLDADATAQVGFIAQEENAVDPLIARIGAVTVGDNDPTTITKQWQRSDSALVPILVAEIKSLRARLAALEARVP